MGCRCWGCVTLAVLPRVGHEWIGRRVRALSSGDCCGAVRRRECGKKAVVRRHRDEGPRTLGEEQGSQGKAPVARSEGCRAGGKGPRTPEKVLGAGGEGQKVRGTGSRARGEAPRARGPAAVQLTPGRTLAVGGEGRHRRASAGETIPTSNGAVRGWGRCRIAGETIMGPVLARNGAVRGWDRRPIAGETIVGPVLARKGADRDWFRPRPESRSRRSRRT